MVEGVNDMKKIIIIGVVFMLSLFSGCNSDFTKNEIDTQANTIFEAIKTKNVDLLKTVLSQNALNSEDLESGIEYCFDLLGEKNFEIEKMGCPEHDRFDSGKRKKWIDGAYIITTDEGIEYFLDFSYWIINENDNNYLGINTMKISINTTDVSQQYISSSEYQRFGIYNPDWDTE